MHIDPVPGELRLDGLEPDNLLAFLALVGLLRAIEKESPELRPRVRWTLDEPVVRPVLQLREARDQAALATLADRGVSALAALHDFDGRADLKLSSVDARDHLLARRTDERAAVASALMSDAAIKANVDEVEPTPLCTLFGQGHQHFLERLRSVPATPGEPKGVGKKAVMPPGSDTLIDTLFRPWRRADRTPSFRWDPKEDVRYAYRAADPSAAKTREGTQHGANRLASVAIASLPCVPMVIAGGAVRAMCRASVRPRGGGRACAGRCGTGPRACRGSWPFWTFRTARLGSPNTAGTRPAATARASS